MHVTSPSWFSLPEALVTSVCPAQVTYSGRGKRKLLFITMLQKPELETENRKTELQNFWKVCTPTGCRTSCWSRFMRLHQSIGDRLHAICQVARQLISESNLIVTWGSFECEPVIVSCKQWSHSLNEKLSLPQDNTKNPKRLNERSSLSFTHTHTWRIWLAHAQLKIKVGGLLWVKD